MWVPEHAAIPENEETDPLAKLGTQKVFEPVGPEPTVGITNSKVIQYLMGITKDPSCRGCLEEEESSGHILMLCPAFTRSRTTFLGQSIMTPRA